MMMAWTHTVIPVSRSRLLLGRCPHLGLRPTHYDMAQLILSLREGVGNKI